MKTLQSWIVLLVLVVDVHTGHANPECPLGWLHFNQSCYHFSDDSLDWYKAESSCRGHNARLAEIDNKGQSDYLIVEAQKLGGTGYWLGGRDDLIEGRWIWASSDLPFTFTDWAQDQPNNYGNNQDCLMMYGGFNMKWNYGTCDDKFRFVCEKEYPSNGGEFVIG